jgi:D-apionolactonase
MPPSTSDQSDADLIRARFGGPVTSLHERHWTLQVRGDEIADIAFDGVTLLRAIRPVIRDRDWNTVPVQVREVSRSPGGLTTVVSFDDGEIRFDGTITLSITAHTLTVDFTGEALSDCETNRAGLVVLHPAADAGNRTDVTHTDESVQHAIWPVEINPHQPFRDVAGFGWTRHGVTAALTLSGEVFETEDQRNWTDASFKTYSTPLDRPFPVANAVGTMIQHTATLHASGTPIGRRTTPDEIIITDTAVGQIPPIGLGAALYPPADPLPRSEPCFEAVLIELTGDEDRWPDLLEVADAQATALHCGLDVRIVTGNPQSVDRCVRSLPPHVTRLGAFDPDSHISTQPLWTALRTSAAAAGIPAALVGGTRAHFTEFNRRLHDIPADVGELTFSLTPQMHAREIPHIIDSLTTQTVVARNAVRLARGRPVHVGPITLARRFNAVATSGVLSPQANAEHAVDPLLNTEFAAAWTLGSVSALSRPGIAGLCYFETGGPRGVEDRDLQKPIGKLLRLLAGMRNRPVLQTDSPADLAALAVGQQHGAAEVLIADLSGRPRAIAVHRGYHTETVDLPPWGLLHLRGAYQRD